MYEKFTDSARKVLQLANQEAQRFNHAIVGTEHVLLGLVKEGYGVAATSLRNLSVDPRKIRLEVEKLVVAGPDMVTMGTLPHTESLTAAIQAAIQESANLKHTYVGTEHILLGLLADPNHISSDVLMNLGVNLNDLRTEIMELLGHGKSVAISEAVDSSASNTWSVEVVMPESAARYRITVERLTEDEETILYSQELAAVDVPALVKLANGF